MKIEAVRHNNHKKGFEVETAERTFFFPYAKLKTQPGPENSIVELYVDDEIGREGFTYVLESGDEGTVHIDHVLDYNQDPSYLRDLLLYKLTLEAQKRIEAIGLSKREVIRRLETSPAQLYRLLDTTNYSKTVDQLLRLLHVLDCDVDLVVHAKTA